ncbi:hypothetical protein BRC83_10050 [Halobacteriales archaeon QS_1_68_17]|nr:MAG: hypothetical protein BRC83_10050 [Halobacteriales archaeon QS_1_68_17]
MSARLTALSAAHLDRLAPRQVADCLAYFDPDAVVLTDAAAGEATRATQAGPLADVEVLAPNPPPYLANRGLPRVIDAGGVDVVVPASHDQLAGVAVLEHEGTVDPATETYVVSDLLEVAVEPTELAARLDGREAYLDALDPGALDGSYTHVAVTAPPSYRRRWDGMRVVGGGTPESEVATLSLSPDGTVCTRSIRETRLGLRAIAGVGATTAARLRERGASEPDDVAAMGVPDLRAVDGVGRGRAEEIADHATAIAEGRVVVSDHEGFPDPDAEPIFLDVETDGLTPTAVWLVGVLDRSRRDGQATAGDGRFRPFLQRDPDADGFAVESFLSWYAEHAAGRPVVAYNGREFDFPVIERHAAEHCPELLDHWTTAPTFDPLAWARDGHAALPGRTNGLSDVAAALGWDGDDTGLTGAAVARRYRRWCRERTAEAELDWDRHVEYCEDDARALARVYDALARADPTAHDRGTGGGSDAGSMQGRLTDFS